MSELTLYHNPRCSKSRQTLALLEENGLEPTIVEYLKTPLSIQGLSILIEQLGISAHALLRSKEAEYSEAELSPTSSDDDIFAAIVKYPVLLERPVVVHKGKAAIGRPPENVLSLFD
tara:strand:+ start:560 stop:910 length:351 start_codon:yes stop_codon:yes gene_type:complete